MLLSVSPGLAGIGVSEASLGTPPERAAVLAEGGRMGESAAVISFEKIPSWWAAYFGLGA